MKTNKGINHFEYTRGIIVTSILWGGFVLFLAITDIISDLTKWAFESFWLQRTVFILFVIVGAVLLVRIGERAFRKLTRNRFKYFPTDKIKKVLEGRKSNDKKTMRTLQPGSK